MMSNYEEMMRALMWPNAVASASLVPHGGANSVQTLGTICEGPGGFKVSLDVHQFAPREISVKSAADSVIVEGKHEERPDEHGYVSRHFLRRYVLKDYDVDHASPAPSRQTASSPSSRQRPRCTRTARKPRLFLS